MYYFKTTDTPVGKLKLIGSDRGLAAVLWEDDNPARVQVSNYVAATDHPVLCEAEQQLNEYFAQQRNTFSIELDFIGTEFQKKVWEALLTIPFGATCTYGDVARQIGNPKAVRAIGGAVNKNPVSIIAPCHRVIGASSKLVGFAGGLENKAYLLRLESSKTHPTLF